MNHKTEEKPPVEKRPAPTVSVFSNSKREPKSEESNPGNVTLILAVVFVIVLYYGADLRLRQSIVLALILALICSFFNHYVDKLQGRISNKLEKPERKFQPYEVRIDPKWEQILLDFHLIDSVDEWEEIKTDVWKALPFGFAFTVLRDSSDSSEKLIYRATGTFTGLVNFRQAIEAIKIGDYPYSHLRVFAQDWANGYELGIIVPTKWWERVKATCPVPLSERSTEWYGGTELVLALIPRTEFAWYLEPENGLGPGNFFKAEPQWYVYEEWRKQVATSQKEERMRLGWNTSALYEDGPEILENSYFSFRHNSI